MHSQYIREHKYSKLRKKLDKFSSISKFLMEFSEIFTELLHDVYFQVESPYLAKIFTHILLQALIFFQLTYRHIFLQTFTEKPETQICLSIFMDVCQKFKKVFKETTFILVSQSRLSSTVPQF